MGFRPGSIEAVMEMKKRPESDRVQPDSGFYLAIERARQGAFSSHPKGMALPAPRFVEALDRASGPPFALLLAQHPAGPRHGLDGVGSGPLQ